MSLTLLDKVWDPDDAANADWFNVGPNTIVLLDGAAPQHPKPVSTFANDAVWLVRRFAELFAHQPLADEIPERVERVRAQLQREYAALGAAQGSTPAEA